MTRVPCAVPDCCGSRDGDPQWTRVLCDGHWNSLDDRARRVYKQAQWAVLRLAKDGGSTAEIRAACVAMTETWKACVADAARRKVAA